MTGRRDRHYGFFGEDGQRKLGSLRVVVVGLGGTGSVVSQELAYLGVGALVLVDPEELDITNLGRYVTARHGDAIPGSPKVRLAGRMISEIDPDIKILEIPESLFSAVAFEEIKAADAVFGCVDHDGVRFVLNELCVAYERPYFDVATGIPSPGDYGGRAYSVLDGNGCLVCWGELDQDEVDELLTTAEQRAARDGAYGVPRDVLGDSGPSVISINGVVASLAVTEFLVWATALRKPAERLVYRGNRAIVNRIQDPAQPDCYYCKSLRGQRETAQVERYIGRDQA